MFKVAAGVECPECRSRETGISETACEVDPGSGDLPILAVWECLTCLFRWATSLVLEGSWFGSPYAWAKFTLI